MNRVPKVTKSRLFGKCPFGPKKAHIERFLQRETLRHDFPKKPSDRLTRERARVRVHHSAKNFNLSFRPMETFHLTCGHFDVGYLLGAAGSLIEQSKQLIVDGVNFTTNISQDGSIVRSIHGASTHFSHHPWRPSKSRMKETRAETPS